MELFSVCVVLTVLVSSVSTAFVRSVSNSTLLTFLKGDSFTRDGRRCHDFCTPDWCNNGGTCYTDETTCIGSCVCTAFYGGSRCQTKRFVDPAILNSFLDALDNESDKNNRALAKDSKRTTNSTTRSSRVLAMLHGIAHIDDRHDIDTEGRSLAIVHHNLNHIDHESDNDHPNITTQESQSHNLSMNDCLITCNNGDCIKINDKYKCKHRINGTLTLQERTCGPGFVCVHGVCDLEAKRNNSYDCICESSYVGQFCDYECPFDCGHHGFCDYDVSDSSYKCFCQWNYTGYNCSELIPIETELLAQPRRHTFHWYVLGASVTIVFLIVVGTFLAGYFLWKRRLVFVLKIVHFFQEYEDDDGKEFDAFVSYKSTERDEKFVLTQLFPRLEGSSRFKLCLHFRDFEPGEAIANNIVRAIENSRRTIMILSPAYVKSEWCRMEYQKAQHEMLKLKHKIIPIVLEDISEPKLKSELCRMEYQKAQHEMLKLKHKIIPIVLEDITEVRDMDTNLKSILDSVTYLQWPGSDSEKKVEKFWTKLELSLPKKSSLSSSSSTSELSSTLSDMSDLSEPITSESVPSDSDIPSNKHKPPLTLSISSETDSSTQDSVDLRKSSKRSERRKKTFRHFIDRFVCSTRSSFSRQDSSSSQTALVDEETVGSRSSCDSMSESNLTESTESICSTPGTANTYLNDTTGVACEPSSYFSVCVDRNAICLDSKEEKADLSEKDQCDLFHSDQRSLHRVGMRGNSCLTVVSENNGKLKLSESGESIDRTFDINEMCELCKIESTHSDNNQVKITTIEGSDQIRIQKLIGSRVKCKHCNSNLARDSGYRGSLKNRKEAVNRELSLLNRSGTLPRNFRSQILARAIQECDEGSIYSDRATICDADAGNISRGFDTATFEQQPDVVIDLDLGNSFSCNGISRYVDVYESI